MREFYATAIAVTASIGWSKEQAAIIVEAELCGVLTEDDRQLRRDRDRTAFVLCTVLEAAVVVRLTTAD